MKSIAELNKLLEPIYMGATLSHDSDQIVLGSRVWMRLDANRLDTWMKSVDELEAANAEQVSELRRILTEFIKDTLK